jgi:actin-related protein 6
VQASARNSSLLIILTLSTAAASMPYSAMFDEPNEPNLPRPECMLIVDSGFSYTHIVPILQGSIVWDAVLR